LGHYWTADDHEAVRRAQVADWLQDMRGFSLEVFAESCSRWRIKETRRPTIAEMYNLCSEVAEMRQEPQQYRPPSDAAFPSKAHRDYLRKKIRVNPPERGPGYFALTDKEKWQYHAYDYAFRKLALHDEKSPIDPDRQWRDEGMIAAAAGIFGGGAEARNGAEDAAEGRAVIEEWARAKGYDSLDAYAAARGIHWTDAYLEKVKENMAAFGARTRAVKRTAGP